VPGGNADAFTTRVEYDEGDQVTAVRAPGKRQPTRTTYDEEGRVTSRVTPAGVETANTYFDNGLLRSVSDPRREASFTYTLAGRKSSMRIKADPGPDIVTTYGYNAKGLLDRTTSPRGNVPGEQHPEDFTTTYFYDGDDNLVRVRRPYPDPPGFVDTDVKSDELDRTVSTVDERRNSTSFERDNTGNVTASTDSLGRTIRMGYDKDGRQTSFTDAGTNTSNPRTTSPSTASTRTTSWPVARRSWCTTAT
jgi:YD repeat-containing protein